MPIKQMQVWTQSSAATRKAAFIYQKPRQLINAKTVPKRKQDPAFLQMFKQKAVAVLLITNDVSTDRNIAVKVNQ